MKPEDFQNEDSNNMGFDLDPSKLELVKLSLAVETRCYLLSVIKNQTAILELLKNGSIDVDRVEEIMALWLDELDELVQTDLKRTTCFYIFEIDTMIWSVPTKHYKYKSLHHTK